MRVGMIGFPYNSVAFVDTVAAVVADAIVVVKYRGVLTEPRK